MVQETLDFIEPEFLPARMIGDNGCDCDALDAALEELTARQIVENSTSAILSRQPPPSILPHIETSLPSPPGRLRSGRGRIL